MTQTATAATHSVRVARTISAEPKRLFRAWTEPEQLAHWWLGDGQNWTFSGATVDLRVGGRFRMGMIDPKGKDHVAIGEYREITSPTRLVFTWSWEDEHAGHTLVTVEFNAVGGGKTDVVLTHELFADEKTAQSHEKGWTQLLGLLERAVV